MAHHWSDNVLTTAFTPRDYQVELLAAAREKNIIICLGHYSSKEFISLKLIHELGYELRSRKHKKATLYLTSNANSNSTYNLIYHLTDLRVINLNEIPKNLIDWEDLFIEYQVVILSLELCLDGLICGYIDLNEINLVVIDDCHKNYGNYELSEIFNRYHSNCETKPKILGLAGPLHSAECAPGRLGGELEYLEKSLYSKAETASDIVTVLRYCSKPIEVILQCAPPEKTEITEFLRNLVLSRRSFIKDHRFDPSEIYEGFLDELKVIPDPKTEPIKFLNEFLEILNELGPWSADRAALLLLVQIEKCKINTPYERHYLLLCLISTTLVQIRAHCDYVFQKLTNEKDRIEKYSTPKVLRLLEILRKFKPSYFNNHNNKEGSLAKQANAKKVNNNPEESTNSDLDGISPENLKNIEQIEALNFVKLADSIDKLKDNLMHTTSSVNKRVTDGLNSVLNESHHDTNSQPILHQPSNRGGGGYRKRFRQRGGYHNNINHSFHHHYHHNSQRKHHYSHYQNESDALCGIIFCNSKFVAKILFGLLCDMTRSDNTYKYLNVQYTVDKEANPLKDLKEAEAEHRKQEEVLKRFRMHECNLLIGTSVLEEGIDLPKCNLVVRWDVPTTYRSYVQCKGRARAQNAYHIIMVSSHPDLQNGNILNDELYQKIHKFACYQNKDNPVDVDEETTIGNCLIKNQVDENNSGENEDLELNKYFGNLDTTTNEVIERLAQYMEIEKMLIRKCENMEPSETELLNADKFTQCIEEYRPIKSKLQSAFVNLSTAVSLVNKYCAKLPSDTFTKLTPLWRSARTIRNGKEYFQCTLRLPINSPVKQDIIGFPMITRILARRSAAFVACKILHEHGELDNNLQPIGKESFRANEPDWENFELEDEDEQIVSDNSEPRPGTTKRRQYYYKRIASTFSKCRPNAGEITYLYHISMILTCPIPEEQNTRGRKIYPPEDALQGFGILTTKKIPKVSSFPIFTRSGEVKVSLELTNREIILDETQLHKIYTFINYTFTNVLRLKKYLMLFDPEATENSFFIVPTIRETIKIADIETNEVVVDWNFLDLINDNIDKMPQHVADEERKNTPFNPDKFKDAVVMPWYRNQDQPQYFYVAEICYHLSPNSSFPGENYTTFQEYYYRKYGIEIQNNKQPLLDVDHTSARLNFLTPRYVNRKGVALPTSSEETKRAKRENLEQKQILVPELCTIHPFPASLWRAAVCLPCILYRINALLLADEIRKQVALDLGLGKQSMDYDNFEWSTLDFGWSLADVLRKSREARIAQSDNLVVAIPDNGYMKKLKEKENSYENIAQIIELDEKFNNLSLEEAEKTANDILEEADQKLKNAAMMEIGIWSNDMAENVIEEKENGWSQIPPNINICSRKTSQIRYGSPTSWGLPITTKDNQFTSSTENLFSDSDASYHTDDEAESVSNSSNEELNPNTAINNLNGLRIEFKSDNVAEAIETEEELLKREKQLAIINDRNINEKNYQISKNICSGFNNCYNNSEDDEDDLTKCENIANILYHEKLFLSSITSLKQFILKSNKLVKFDQELNIIQLGEQNNISNKLIEPSSDNLLLIYDLIPYLDKTVIDDYLLTKYDSLDDKSNIRLKINDLFELNKLYINQESDINECNEKYAIEGTGDIFDNFNDQHITNNKDITINFNEANTNIKKPENNLNDTDNETVINYLIQLNSEVRNTLNGENNFSFDYQPNLNGHPGPSPSIILQGLTMSNANDGINLERLETIGDSFLKYAITTYLYCAYENVHEGKLSHLRSKQVSNLNLYRLGRRKNLGENMIATKFEPHDNWLPPCYYVPRELEKALIEAKIPACHWNLAELPNLKRLSSDEICALVKQRAESLGLMDDLDDYMNNTSNSNPNGIVNLDNFPCFIPYNLVTQHSIPDKSIADCVEALIGAYLIECGPRGALLFMAWLGIRVLPIIDTDYNESIDRIPGSLETYVKKDKTCQKVYGHWSPPKSPLLRHVPNAEDELDKLLDGYEAFENAIGYDFNDRSYLLQAMTHASYSPNRLTDCYQRLEFLGDAVLDYLITRHLYEDPRQHSPGALTDLRSALVNNTIFASLAVRHGFHKYFRHLSPGLNEVIDRFVRIQHENGHSISEEFYLLSEEECDEAEDVEVPKALGDVFESVAGAIFLDSNMSLDTVWKIYSNMMRPEIEQFSNSVPKSPIRELLELEPETAKFGKPEKLADGRRVRVTVEVFGKGTFRGIGRNYRIAKCTAAKCALRQLKKQGLISKKH